MKTRLLVVFSVYMSFFCSLFAEVDVRSMRLTTADGLANNSVRHILQDSKGFIWMGTLNGLSRYDGNTFITFRPKKDSRISLPDHRIQKLTEDKNCFLWIQTSGELVGCYDLKRDCFVDFTGCGEYMRHYWHVYFANDREVWLSGERDGCRLIRYQDDRSFKSIAFDKHNGLRSNQINQLVKGGEGWIWMATRKGLYCWDGSSLHEVASTGNFQSIAAWNGRTYFFSSEGKFYLYDKQRGGLQEVASAKGPFRFTDQLLLKEKWLVFTEEKTLCFRFDENALLAVSAKYDMPGANVFVDNKGDAWIHNNTGKLVWIDVQSEKVKRFSLLPDDRRNYIDTERYYVVRDSRNIIWIATYGNGLFAYDATSKELCHFDTRSGGTEGLIGSDYMQSLMVDRSGNIWTSGEYAGVSMLEVLSEGTLRLFPGGERNFSRSNAVRMISKLQSGEMVVCTRDGGMYVYDSRLEHVKEKNVYDSNIYSVAVDSAGVQWYASRTKGLKVGDRLYLHDSSDSSSLGSNQVFCLLKDRKNHMWVGTFGGGLALAIPGEKENEYTFRHFFTSNYAQKQIRTICEDSNGWIWIGTSGGVYVFDPERLIKDSDAYYAYTFEKGLLRSDEVRSIMSDGKGHVFIGESGFGFSVCSIDGRDYANLDFKRYGENNGLVSGMVQAFAPDHMGNVWITTEYGVSCFNPTKETFENYYFSASMLGDAYCENCCAVLDDGRLVFGTNYGLTIIDPRFVRHPYDNVTVTFTGLHLNGILTSPNDPDSPLVSSLAYSSDIRLAYYQNSFVVDFSTFNYSKPSGGKFSYMLENYDKRWSVPTALNFAAYKNLSPGTYFLHVKASNESGVWGQGESVLKIVVETPLWRTWWAYLLYFIALCAILYWVFCSVRDRNNLRNKIKVEEQLTEYKLVFFTNISHEFRTPLTLIQGALEKIHKLGCVPKEMAYSVKVMDKSTARLLRLINQLLEFRKMQNNKLALSLEETDVIAFLYEIYLSFKDAAESKKMDFRFISSVPSYRMYIDKGNIDKVAYNIVSNAFKYTPSGGRIEFVVTVDEAAGKLSIKVSDTGVGVPKEKQGELFKRFMQSSFSRNSVGVGLHLTNELVNVHKGTISFAENPGGGSIFTVTLPLDKSVYEEKDFLIANNVLLQEEEKAERHLADIVLKDESLEDGELPVVPLNKWKVLVVEDDNDVREFLKAEMEKYFELSVAADGESGLEYARNFDVDLIISDVLMPGCSGFELTKRLKNDFNTSHIPVILLTALDSEENHLKGVECGADAYIVKPFSVRLLLTRALKLIEQREKLKEKFAHDPNQTRPAVYSSDKDKTFVEKMFRVVQSQMENPQFTVDEFASMMGVGRSVFYRKVRGLTGYSPNEYIRVMRMKKAAELLVSAENLTVAQISYMVGINDPFYFSKCFKSQFGITPSAYQKGDHAGKKDDDMEEKGEEEEKE